MFPISTKKCEILFGIFAQIFNSAVFCFEKSETAFHSDFFFLWRQRDAMSGAAQWLFLANDPQNAESSGFAVKWPFFFGDHLASHTENTGFAARWPFFFGKHLFFFKSALWKGGITKPKLRHFCQNLGPVYTVRTKFQNFLRSYV